MKEALALRTRIKKKKTPRVATASHSQLQITKRVRNESRKQNYRLFEVLYAHMPLWATKTRVIHGIDIQGYQYNGLDIFLAWPIYREWT